MSKRSVSVGILTAGLSVGLAAAAISPAAAQGNPVGGKGNVYFLSGAMNHNGVAQQVNVFGDPNDEVYYGDWDGDGTDTPLVRRGISFFVADASGKTVDVFSYGNPGDQVLIGDWNGDYVDSIAVRRGNAYFVKNDTKKSGVADTTFNYGDNSDVVLVGNWDGLIQKPTAAIADDPATKDKDESKPASGGKGDTLIVQRGATFFVKNDLKTGNAEYTFVFGSAGDTILVGDWATLGADGIGGVDGNGADQLAVRRGNMYHQSEELSKGKSGLSTTKTFAYGDAGDHVFVASLPSAVIGKDGKPVIDVVRPQVHTADVAATRKAGEPILLAGGSVGAGYTQSTDPITGVAKTYAGGEAAVALPGLPSVYKGGEGVVTADGKAVVYVASGATGDNQVNITAAEGWVADAGSTTSGTTSRYKAGDPVLNSDGGFVWVKNTATTWTIQTWAASDAATTKALPTGDANKIKIKVGDQVVRRSGQQAVIVKGSPAVYPTSGSAVDGNTTGAAVIVSAVGDLVLNSDNTVARDVNGAVRTHSVVTYSPTATYKASTPVLYRKGQYTLGHRHTLNTGRVATDGVTASSTTVTSATALFTANDVGRSITGAGIPASTTITAVGSATSVTISNAATATATGVSLTLGVGRLAADGATNSNTSVTSASYAFTALDVGRTITGAGIPAGTTIASVTNATTVVISAAATATATGVTITVGATSAWAPAANIVDDEAANVYLTKPTGVNDAPTSANKLVSTIDADVDVDPVYYLGTEQWITTAEVNVPATIGGEVTLAYKAGDLVLDKDGNPTTTGTGKPFFVYGDGLGVRRNFG